MAYDCVERNPYGTPISLPIHSPFHMLSSSQDDPVAIPDSPPQEAWARSYNTHRAAPSLNAERAKSESPELSMSIHEYPSSQPPQEHATFVSLTPNSSQIALSQAHQQSGKNAVAHTLPDSESSLQARCASPRTGGSVTYPSFHHGYHIFRSVAQQRPSQTDPIETDDSLSQEQISGDRLAKRHLDHSLPVTSITLDRAQLRFPNDSTSDERNIQSTGLGDSSNLRTEQSPGAPTQVSGPSAIHGATFSKEVSKPPLVTTAIDLQGHLPTLTARREDFPDQAAQAPLLERSGAQEGQDLSLGSTSFDDVRAGKAFATGHYPRELQAEPTNDLTATEATSSLQTPLVRKSILDENPTPQLQIVKAPLKNSQTRGDTEVSRQTQLKPDSGPSDKPITVADGDAQFDRELMASVKPSKKQDGDAEFKEPEQATQGDQPICDIGDSPFDGGVNTVQGENTADCTSVSGGTISQKQPRLAVVDTPKKRSGATQEAVSTNGSSDCKAPRQSSVSKTETSGRKTGLRFEHPEGDVGMSGTGMGKVIVKTNRSAEEKRKAEDKAIREADAVARLLANEERRSCTPSFKSTSKRDSHKSNQAPQSLTKDASVQGVRQTSNISTQQPSLPKFGNKSLGKPRSMTPLVPSATLIRPTKSALRKSQSSTPRSVSFNDDPVAPPGPLKTTASKWVEPKIESCNGASGKAKGFKATSKKVIAKPKTSQIKDEQVTPFKKDLKASGSKSGPQAVKQTASALVTGLPKPKTQTKLTITRDVKLKGRADRPPKSPTPATQKEEEDIVSDSEVSASTFYSDEENLPRSAKAGPSKKRKLTHALKSAASSLDIGSEEKQQSHTTVSKAEVHPSVPSADSVHVSHQNSTVRHSNISASKPKPEAKPSSPRVSDQKSNIVAQVDSREASKSRSPALYMSRASRASSGSASDGGPRAEHRSVDESISESGSSYETDSDSEEASASGSESAETESLLVSNRRTSLPNGVEKDKDLKGSKSRSQSSNRLSSRKTLSVSSRSASQLGTDEEDNEKLARNLDQQLQRDARHSMKLTPQETTVQSSAKTEKSAPISVKPGVSRFPSLTGLRGKASKTEYNAGATTTQPPKTSSLSNVPSEPVKQLQTQTVDDTSSSSSESEDETSSSDDQQNKVNGQSSKESAQKTSTPQPRPMKGIRALLKRRFSDGVPDT